MKKTNKILIIIIVILTVLLLCSIALGLYLNRDKKIYYECTSEIESTSDVKLTITNELIAEQDGLVKEVNTRYIYKYETNESYNQAVSYYSNVEDVEYKLNNTKLEITVISNTNDYLSYDEEENIIETWYKSYLATMNDLGYSCDRK